MAARADAEKFYARPAATRKQTRHSFQQDLWFAVAQDLRKLFRGKCAYCEKRFTKSDAVVVDHFRPPAHAKQLGGSSSAEHYWWLAYEYDNLYPACEDCRRHKATLFPVKGKRAYAGAVGPDLAKERALLLDPCVDRTEEYFHYLTNGEVIAAARRKKSEEERANTTIEVLALNRPDLVAARLKAMEEVVAACEALSNRSRRLVAGTGAVMSHPASRVRKLLAPWLPYGAARRHAALRALRDMRGYGEQIMSLVPELAFRTVDDAAAYLQKPRVRKRRTAYVRELIIENFKAIRKLALTFQDPVNAADTELPFAGWRVFVGENGSGKSSVLQALALALAGEYQVRRIVVNWDKVLRRARGKRRRPSNGFVKVVLSTGDMIDLRFNRQKGWFKSGAEGALTALRAYGATRNLPNTRTPASWKSVEATVRVINLFDAYSPLCSAEGWMAGLSKDRFDVVALALKDLMQLQSVDRIRRERRKTDDHGRRSFVPIVDIGNSSNRLDELSDGYQSMIALAIEIMAGLPKKSTDFQSDTGIVIVDELGNHLHPTWRMQVVASLRRTFPRLQFIVTTHDPLCLRGLEVGEIAVLRRDKYGITAQIVNEPIGHLRADQLLTSPLFGLSGTRDPKLIHAGQVDERRYDALFLKKDRSPAEEGEFQQIRAAIVRRTAGGETTADRFVEQAVRLALNELPTAAPPPTDIEQRPAPDEIRTALKSKFAELLA